MKAARSLPLLLDNDVEDNQLLIEDAQIGKLSTDNIYKSTETEQINDVRNSFKAKKIRWKHAVSSALLKAFESKSVGGSVDSHRKPLGYLDKNISAVKNFTSLQNSPVKTTSYNFDVMAPPSLMSITSSQISGSWDGSIADDEVDRIASLKELSNGQHKCNDSTASLGPGQVKPAFPESKSKGELKVSLIVTKGHLEVEITSAKSLSASSPSPDTYVKTYLTDGRRRVQKRKTKVIRGCSEPTFKQKLKYYARDIFGRRIEVSLWEKSSVFDKNHCLGAAEINLEDIDLSVQSAGWYQLHKTMNVMEYGSTNSLDN